MAENENYNAVLDKKYMFLTFFEKKNTMKYSEKLIQIDYWQENIKQYSQDIQKLPILASTVELSVLAHQLVDSLNRKQYFALLQQRDIHIDRISPYCDLFDPIRAVIALKERHFDEACWLTFLLVHTGNTASQQWQLVRDLYGNWNKQPQLTWHEVNKNLSPVSLWIKQAHQQPYKPKFGSHRKYETIAQLEDVIYSYIQWVKRSGGHKALFLDPAFDPKIRYQQIYAKMNVLRFGRLAKYDYLGLLSRTGVANLQADQCYLVGASGPLKGAKRMFGLYEDEALNTMASKFADEFDLDYQVFEEALCNWQKSPMHYKYVEN